MPIDIIALLQGKPYTVGTIATLRAHDITSDETLYIALEQVGSHPERDEAVCSACYDLGQYLEVDRLVRLLPRAIIVGDPQSAYVATQSLGRLADVRVIEPLMQVILNPLLDSGIRERALDGLEECSRETALPLMHRLMLDESQPSGLRGRALEISRQVAWLDDYVSLLDAPEAEIRFWACFALTCIADNEITAAREQLDELACWDDAIPPNWGWSVGREALLPLAHAYHGASIAGVIWVISPRLEYSSLNRSLMIENGERGWHRDLSRVPQPTLRIDPEWLREQMVTRWPKAEFDVYQPRPRTYALNWRLRVNNMLLHGGLHVDGYTVVLYLTNDHAAYRFAAWYRGQVTDTPLYLTRWADESTELLPGMTAWDIHTSIEERDAARRRLWPVSDEG